MKSCISREGAGVISETMIMVATPKGRPMIAAEMFWMPPVTPGMPQSGMPPYLVMTR